MHKKKEYRIVRSSETGKQYRVLREYRNCLLVTPADRKRTIPFTMPRSSFVGIECGGGHMRDIAALTRFDTIKN